MKTHDLKTWPDVFQAVWDGRKTAEFRRNDREFEVGDQLRLNEWLPGSACYTGRVVVATVTHVSRGGRSGIPEGYAMLSLGETLNWGPLEDRTLLRDLLEPKGPLMSDVPPPAVPRADLDLDANEAHIRQGWHVPPVTALGLVKMVRERDAEVERLKSDIDDATREFDRYGMVPECDESEDSLKLRVLMTCDQEAQARQERDDALTENRDLKAENARLKGILNDAWFASGLLCAEMTGKPDQAYEEPSDLVDQIAELAYRASARDEAEKEADELRAEVERLKARCEFLQKQWVYAAAVMHGNPETLSYSQAYRHVTEIISAALAEWDREHPAGGPADE